MEKVQIGDATLYLGDCLDVLPTLSKVDALITDPPYGNGFAAEPTKWQRRAGMKGKDWDDQPSDALYMARSVCKKQVIWGGNNYELPPSRAWLSWFKPDAPPSMGNFELAWTNLDRNTRQISCSISQTNAERVGHPTQKPLLVMRWTIEQAGLPASILDPFMGSGTTGVAALQLGRKFTGIERDPAYFEIACRRIREFYSQPSLFAQEAPVQAQQMIFARQ